MFAWFKSLFAGKSQIAVSIPVAENFPNQEELDARNLVMDTLASQGIGDFVGAGGGFNQMDFEYKVSDPDAAKQLIAQDMERHLPGRVYCVSVE